MGTNFLTSLVSGAAGQINRDADRSKDEQETQRDRDARIALVIQQADINQESATALFDRQQTQAGESREFRSGESAADRQARDDSREDQQLASIALVTQQADINQGVATQAFQNAQSLATDANKRQNALNTSKAELARIKRGGDEGRGIFEEIRKSIATNGVLNPELARIARNRLTQLLTDNGIRVELGIPETITPGKDDAATLINNFIADPSTLEDIIGRAQEGDEAAQIALKDIPNQKIIDAQTDRAFSKLQRGFLNANPSASVRETVAGLRRAISRLAIGPEQTQENRRDVQRKRIQVLRDVGIPFDPNIDNLSAFINTGNRDFIEAFLSNEGTDLNIRLR